MNIRSNMSGSLWKLVVKVGDQVEAGQEVAILESMKMEIPIVSEGSGVVEAILKNEGDFVQEDEVVVRLQA
ncbi:acetyl-CoA carboxylase biotin carboxyl carrier protein subunit [Neobacillus sp. YX16]|jgi:acetyl-CoA carboxylase biotin carboxyl carrier protein|uniref:acetyl-CoA carboxylase biotin carboxyl carrier protein subunit n=1 Tax=Bacillaceae TaxID=186817 RepID=UPI000BA7C899|nr:MULTISPECIES: acetyl-CoA carboxylase biotin carboxyl carrier protein subunit [Bacillaceae]PAE33774.1 acetyl-CoA carboxylase biotin carboxyl carrier protein subunit [Bacillus sp. 7884-1]WHZ06082.1 acetyl-CoA carboxylase biotin carboxyl carrier protein subunit [Neobacillus sp. YX16]